MTWTVEIALTVAKIGTTDDPIARTVIAQWTFGNETAPQVVQIAAQPAVQPLPHILLQLPALDLHPP